MKADTVATRRRLLALLCAFPVTLASGSIKGQPSRLELSSYFQGETSSVRGARLFADKVTADSAGTMQVALEAMPPWVPLQIMSRESALAHYCAPAFADVEPLLGLSALPMLTATFDEAEILLQIARPHYSAALARHGQILLATQPSRPAALWSTFRIRSAADLQGAMFPLSSHVGEKAGWGRTFIRSGARPAAYSEAELMLSSGDATDLKLTQEFAYLTEIFLSAQLDFVTVSRQVLESLTEAQANVLWATGRTFEHSQWRLKRELVHHDHQVIAARGVPAAGHPPADVLVTLRAAAEPDIQSWANLLGTDGATILTDYRRAIGRQ